ncbi:MAG TPA: YraN family protein [Candidatus Treponema faecavium]|nr:YraN family protein [Candidatus Treponema faecavium]
MAKQRHTSELAASAVFRGKAGEDRAAKYFTEHGYTIVERNWRIRGGEIDIIAQCGDTLVFVEVKTFPRGSLYTLEQVLGQIKQQKLIKTAKCFLSTYRKYNSLYIRFDVCVLDMPGLPQVWHIENAFSELT